MQKGISLEGLDFKIRWLETFLNNKFMTNRPRSIYQYSNMDPRLSGQNCTFFNFSRLAIPKRDLDTKKTTPNTEVCPESLGAMLEY